MLQKLFFLNNFGFCNRGKKRSKKGTPPLSMAFMGIGEVTFNPFSPKQLFMGKKGRWTKARLSAPEDYEGLGGRGAKRREGGREPP